VRSRGERQRAQWHVAHGEQRLAGGPAFAGWAAQLQKAGRHLILRMKRKSKAKLIGVRCLINANAPRSGKRIRRNLRQVIGPVISNMASGRIQRIARGPAARSACHAVW